MQVMYYYHTRRKGDDAIRASREAVELRILSLLDNLGDLHAAAMVNRSFYDTYKKNELLLMRGILKREAMRRRSDPSSLMSPSSSSSSSPGKLGRPQKSAPVAMGNGGARYWMKSFENQQQLLRRYQQYQHYGSMEARCSTSILPGNNAAAIPVANDECEKEEPAAASVPVSYFDVSDDDDEEDEDGNAGTSSQDNNEERGERRDSDVTVTKQSGTVMTTMRRDEDDTRRDSISAMVTREEAEQILWPPKLSDSNDNNSSSSSNMTSPSSLPPSYTFASTHTTTTVTPNTNHAGDQVPRQQQQGSTAAEDGPGNKEKFLGDGAGLVPTEHKSLLPSENKHLRETYNRLVGLRVDEPHENSFW